MSSIQRLPEFAKADDEVSHRRTYFTADHFIDEWVEDYTGHCSFCSEPLTLPAIMWHMFSGTLWLHQECARNLGVCLIGDAAQIGYVHKNQIKRTVAQLTGEGSQ